MHHSSRTLTFGLLAGATVILVGLFSSMQDFARAPSVPPEPAVHTLALHLLVATTTADQEKGLGVRASLPADAAMLFVFKKADRYGIWMKDMHFPIDVMWLQRSTSAPKGQFYTVVTVVEDMATSSYPHVFYPSGPASDVLETNAGVIRAQGLVPGSVVRLQNLGPVLQ